jgi:hypothetical protein
MNKYEKALEIIESIIIYDSHNPKNVIDYDSHSHVGVDYHQEIAILEELVGKATPKHPTNFNITGVDMEYEQMCPTCGEWAHEFYPDCYNDCDIVVPCDRCKACNQLFDWDDM